MITRVKALAVSAFMGTTILFMPVSPVAAQTAVQDGLVNVAVGDVTILEDVNIGVAAQVIAQVCGVKVGPVAVLATQNIHKAKGYYLLSGGKILNSRALNAFSELIVTTAVTGTVPRLLGRIPVHDAVQVCAYRAAFAYISVFIFVAGNVLGTLDHDSSASRLEVLNVFYIASFHPIEIA